MKLKEGRCKSDTAACHRAVTLSHEFIYLFIYLYIYLFIVVVFMVLLGV